MSDATTPRRLYGKYRGVVMNNIDPMQKGRILFQATDASLIPRATYAMPCVPNGGVQSGTFVLPSPGSGVWIEFEEGDPDRPIWTGGFWGSAADVPALALIGNPASPSIVLQTMGQTTLMLSDLPGPTGGIMLKTLTGAMILINDIGITISNGKGAMIQLTGPSVMINNGALTVI
jgi:hypothetical protein